MIVVRRVKVVDVTFALTAQYQQCPVHRPINEYDCVDMTVFSNIGTDTANMAVFM